MSNADQNVNAAGGAVYEKLKAEALKELDRCNNSPVIEEALSLDLRNNSEETDYDLWSEGCDKLAMDNYEVLRKLVFCDKNDGFDVSSVLKRF